MLAFIINRKNLILDNINPNSMQLGIRKEILELEVKNKMKRIKAFDPGVLTELNGDQSDQLSQSGMSDRSLNKKEDNNYAKSVMTNITFNRQKNLHEKISAYKKFYSVIDLISTVLVIVSAVLSVIENDFYYEDNREVRIISAILYNGIRSFGGNHTAEELFKDIDLNYILTKGNESSANITEINGKVLSKYNLQEDFKFSPGPHFDYTNISVPIVVSSYCSNLRLLITVLSLISGKFMCLYCSWVVFCI